MNNEKTDRIINRHYIGVVKEIDNRLKYIEVEIPQEDVLIGEIEAMKKNDNRSLIDVQNLFTLYYPKEELQYKDYDYLFPCSYSSAYVSGVDYPTILTCDKYKATLDEHEKKIRDEEYLFKYCDESGELKKLKEESDEKFKDRIEEIVTIEMREYVNSTRKGFKYQRFIFAHRYTEKLRDIKKESNVKMWSTDQIGWKEFHLLSCGHNYVIRLFLCGTF